MSIKSEMIYYITNLEMTAQKYDTIHELEIKYEILEELLEVKDE